jgi:amidohydrolase
MKEILQRLLPQLIKIRHQIHSNPELANGERNTASLIIKTLKQYGYQVNTGIAGNGISAVLDSKKPGRTVALRADMDALPLHEQTNLPYQSINKGIMHACGHDGHTVTLLAVAGALMECTQQFQGKIKFIFQPAEEIGTGAAAMIENGILEEPKVDAIFGYHNTPRSKPGMVVTKSGCIMAGQDTFSVTIKGKGGHAAHLNTVIDPIYIGSAIIQAIQSIVSRFTSPIDSVVVSVTEFHAVAYKVTPDEAKLTGTIRTITSESQNKVKQQLKNIVDGIATTF